MAALARVVALSFGGACLFKEKGLGVKGFRDLGLGVASPFDGSCLPKP